MTQREREPDPPHVTVVAALWALLPAGVYAAHMAPALIGARAGRPVSLGLLVLLGAAILGLMLVARRLRSAVAWMFAGALVILAVGPGVSPLRDGFARGVLLALMILLAWIGWSFLHPDTRAIAVRVLRGRTRPRPDA